MKVSDWSNQWTKVFDFTENPPTMHWGFLPETCPDLSKQTVLEECWQECFVLCLEKDAALAYAYAIAAVWKNLCVTGLSRPGSVSSEILTSFLCTLGIHSDKLQVWLQILIAARVIAMGIEGPNCRQLLDAAIQELGNDKAHFFITTNLKTSSQQPNCSYFAAKPAGQDMSGSKCQLLLRQSLQLEG
ncbi:unnamed protein product [Sphagnum tenellum]|uniref:Uncharacterized protein n=1 Tax=Sphagnum jensenii TaxID=128206 RepID=A0ABP0WJY0_9BRYO